MKVVDGGAGAGWVGVGVGVGVGALGECVGGWVWGWVNRSVAETDTASHLVRGAASLHLRL